MAPKTTNDNCELCHEHSGIMTWLKGIVALLGLATGLLAYSVGWQAPDLKMEIAKNKADSEKIDEQMKHDIQLIKQDVTVLQQRISKLQ